MRACRVGRSAQDSVNDYVQPEMDLLCAILNRAIDDLRCPKHRKAAIKYLTYSKDDEVLSVRWVCMQLSPNAEYLLQELLKIAALGGRHLKRIHRVPGNSPRKAHNDRCH